MISGFFDHDTTDDLVLAWFALGAIGLVLAFRVSVRSWRLQMAALLALSALLAEGFARALASNDYGSDCGEPHHEGEWPMLILTVAWSLFLLVCILLPNPPAQHRAFRVGTSLVGAAFPLGTVAYIVHVQPPC
jgi:hypothetical protein